MIQHHLGKSITDNRASTGSVSPLETADELNLPSASEFRSALVAYLEWGGSRLAVINSAIPADTP